jgi:ABC-2 type transport system ATP-binding protein
LGGPVIEARELTRTFGRFTAVDRVSFRVERGEIFGFLGPNGAGKSTTIRLLCGILGASSGTASVAGRDIRREPERVKENIGYMSQRFSLYRDLTVAENIRFFGGIYGLDRPALLRRQGELLSSLGLRGSEGRLAGDLAGGLQQRLALACALLHSPPVLFLDEPTSGVDPISRRRFWDLIDRLSAEGTTIFVTTHFLDEAEHCHRLSFIHGGRLIAEGTPEALRRGAIEEDLYEVRVTPLERVRERLLERPGVESVSFFGERLHVFLRRGSAGPAELTAWLAEGGFRVLGIEPTEVTLEDVFIRLIERREGRE